MSERYTDLHARRIYLCRVQGDAFNHGVQMGGGSKERGVECSFIYRPCRHAHESESWVDPMLTSVETVGGNVVTMCKGALLRKGVWIGISI